MKNDGVSNSVLTVELLKMVAFSKTMKVHPKGLDNALAHNRKKASSLTSVFF